VRGLNLPSKQQEVRRLVQEKKVHLVCLIETRVKEAKAVDIVSALFPSWQYSFNYDKHYLGRVWVCWDSSIFDISVMEKTDQSISCCIHSIKEKLDWFHTFVYGANKSIERRPLWQHLHSIKARVSGHPWIISGDFNVVRNLDEKWGSHSLNTYEVEFGDCLNELEVTDLRFFWLFLYLE
jgi:hypothetical protein